MDFGTGVSPRSGDLRESLAGSCGTDRGRGVTWAVARSLSGVPSIAAGLACLPAGDSFSTIGLPRAAELSTVPLRRRPAGRCAAPWITSGMVSVRGGAVAIAKQRWTTGENGVINHTLHEATSAIVRRSVDIGTGLVRCAAKPAAKLRCTSSSVP